MNAVLVEDLVTRYRSAIEQEMRTVVGDAEPLLYRIIRYHLGWQEPGGQPGPGSGGKALRPTLCLLACGAVSADGGWQQALPVAAALELIHNFSLVHDDIQDQDRERHHRPTVWTIWGVPQGINAGDGLWALANRSFLRAAERQVEPAVLLRAYGMLNDACMTMIEGQALDLAFEEQRAAGDGLAPVSVEAYLDMIARKTGALLAAALGIGALIGSGDTLTAAAFHRFGAQLGRVYQVHDDLLGIWGQADRTGKPAASDIRRRKQSFPMVYTFNHADPDARAALASVYAAPEMTDEDVRRAVAAMEACGAREAGMAVTTTAHAEAVALLEVLPVNNQVRTELRAVLDFLIERDR